VSRNTSDHNTEAMPLFGLVLVAVLVLLWGSNFPAMKLGLSEIAPFTFRTISNAIAAIGLLCIGVLLMREPFAIPRQDFWPVVAAGMLNIAGWQLFLTFGLLEIDAAKAVIIAYTMPLWAAFLARFFLKEKLSVVRLLGIVFGISGVLVLNIGKLDGSMLSVRGVLLVLAAALCWAGGTVAIKMHRWRLSTIMLTAWQVAVGTVPMIIGMAVMEDPTDIRTASLPAIGGMLYTAIIAMVICHWTWYSLLRLVPAAVAAASTLAIPISGVYMSALVLGEQVGWREVSALTLVITGLFFVLVWPVLRERLSRLRIEQ